MAIPTRQSPPGPMPKPSAFMRRRRPNLFSDSLADVRTPLSRAEFEYQLETLTSRSQEAPFQRFAHALLEVEICPNLLPQTGPTGGGDSKVDAQTYQVADAIAARWWSGTAREGASEDWAFAISAKKAWKAKAKKDVESVLASGNPYSRIHFVTNQYVRDKDRDTTEKALTKTARGVPVRIFDRSWLLQAVFDHDHWDIAARELGLESLHAPTPGAIGPLDADRARQLAQVDAELADPQRFASSSSQLAQAWLTSALLARGLGRGREETDQRFDRAIEAARAAGGSRALRRMLYQKAWTAFWWFDDMQATLGGYDAIEALLDDGEINAWDLEQLTNLYSALNSAEVHGWLPAGAAHLKDRRERLDTRLKPLAERRSHPTDAALARTHRLMLQFLAEPTDPKVHEDVVQGFRTLVTQVRQLPEYPVESLCQVITIFTDMPFEVVGIDEVADQADDLVRERVGAQAFARQLVSRATTKLRKGAAEEAVRLVGRTWAPLQHQPSRDLFLEGGWVAALAYCELGLHCAARAHLILALNRSLRTVVEDADLSSEAVALALRMAWIELAAGRLPMLLDAIKLADRIALALDLPPDGMAAYLEERNEIEALLVQSVVASPSADRESIQWAPALFGEHQLPVAEQCTRILLGHPETDDLLALTGGTTFDEIRSWGAPKHISPIVWSETLPLTVRTRVMGCELEASGIQTKEARALVMAVFAAVEAFAATAFADRMAPSTSFIAITVDDGLPEQELRIEVEEDDCGEPVVHLRYRRGGLQALATDPAFMRTATEGVANILSHALDSGPRVDLAQLIETDAVLDRAFGLLYSCALDEAGPQSDPSLRGLLAADAVSCPVVGEGRFANPGNRPAERTLWDAKTVPEGEPMPFELDVNHSRVQLASVINLRLWNRAKWGGVSYSNRLGEHEPSMDLMFRDDDAAIKILRGLRRRIGDHDPDHRLRIGIMTGIDRSHPSHYRMIVAPEAAVDPDDRTRTFVMAVRMHTMLPATSVNLDRFLEHFRREGHFLLGTSVWNRDPTSPPEFVDEEPIRLRRLDVKPAWQISENDILFNMLLQPEDDPWIPDDVTAPESLAVHRMMAARRKKAGA